MLGSLHDAEDALQEALLRAWRGLPGFEGRGSVRSWLYAIATNAALDTSRHRSRRELPVDFGPAAGWGADLDAPLTDPLWLEPYPDQWLGDDTGASPEARYEQRESVELAFVVALQHLPPLQRAVLILREVVGFSTAEISSQLGVSAPSVNSARCSAPARLPAAGCQPEAAVHLAPAWRPAHQGHRRAVSARLTECHVIIAEGITGRSITGSALTLAYRLPARRRRLALTVQQIDYASLGIPVVRPDITAKQFRKSWRSVPALQRLAIWCLAPPFALAFALLGTRRTIGRHLGTDDLPTHQEDEFRYAARELTEVILDHRDALLVESVASIHQARQTENIDVAVVYGAGHMPALTYELLRRYGYRPRTAEWMTVFDF